MVSGYEGLSDRGRADWLGRAVFRRPALARLVHQWTAGKDAPIGNISVLILSSEGLRIFESGGLCTPVERGWMAVGSGSTSAMGAFMAGADAKKAVEIACQIDTASGGQIHVHKLK